MSDRNGYDLMNYEIEGDGPNVILLHGMSSCLNDWRKLQPELVKAGYRVIAADLLGHGDSAKPKDARLYTTKAVYAVLEDWIDYLQLSEQLSEPFYLVGHSLGGYMSLMYALRNPSRVRKMILINPLYSLKQLTPALTAMMPLNFVGVKVLENTPQWVVNSFLSWSDSFTTKLSAEDRKIYARDVKRASPDFLRIPASAEDMTPHLAEICTPALVIWGVEDHIENPGLFEPLAMGLPNGSGCPIPGCGHQPHHGNPGLVKLLTLNYLRAAIDS